MAHRSTNSAHALDLNELNNKQKNNGNVSRKPEEDLNDPATTFVDLEVNALMTSSEVSDWTMRNCGKLPNRATTRPVWAQPPSPSGSHPGMNSQTPEGLEHPYLPGKIHMMKGAGHPDETQMEVRRTRVATVTDEPTDPVSISTPPGAQTGTADEYLIRSEAGSWEDDARAVGDWRNTPRRDPLYSDEEDLRRGRETTVIRDRIAPSLRSDPELVYSRELGEYTSQPRDDRSYDTRRQTVTTDIRTRVDPFSRRDLNLERGTSPDEEPSRRATATIL